MNYTSRRSYEDYHNYSVEENFQRYERDRQNLVAKYPDWDKATIKLRNNYAEKLRKDKNEINLGVSIEYLLDSNKNEANQLISLRNYEIQELESGRFGKDIWFTGRPNIIKNEYDSSLESLNHGFDAKVNLDGNKKGKGSYKVIIGDHILYRYEILKYLSNGSFGKVVLVKDHKYKNDIKLALKILNNGTSYNQHYLQQEAITSKNMKNAMTKLDYSFLAPIKESSFFRNHIILTYDLLGKSVTSKYDKGKTIQNVELLKTIAWDMLESLASLKRLDVLHNDMKYDNFLLLKSETEENYRTDYPYIKIMDYGHSCLPTDPKPTHCRGKMVAHYKSPEALLNYDCTTACDMWCYGSALGRLITGSRLIESMPIERMLAEMINIIGEVPEDMLKTSEAKRMYEKAMKVRINDAKKEHTSKQNDGTHNNNTLHSSSWRVILGKADHVLKNDDLFIDFIEKILTWDPSERLTPYEAMAHPWFDDFATKRFALHV